MSNLYNQNIGQNYRGILNLDSTINTPLDATLRAVTDGMGTASVLNLSTEQVSVLRTVNLAAGATNPSLFNVVYTINNSGAQTGTLRGIFLNATETALNGITHNLMDLQVGGVSRVRIANNGAIYLNASLNAYLFATTNGQVNLVSNSGTGQPVQIGVNGEFKVYSNTMELNSPITTAIKLSGNTNLFPMIKRNGAAIDFRLADDSAPCTITASTFTQTAGDFSTIISGTNFSIVTGGGNITYNGISRFAAGLSSGSANLVGSAILQADSTTRGFLPPRMTTTQINAIVTPAEGLVVYNTTISHLCVYQAGAWVKLSHSPM